MNTQGMSPEEIQAKLDEMDDIERIETKIELMAQNQQGLSGNQAAMMNALNFMYNTIAAIAFDDNVSQKAHNEAFAKLLSGKHPQKVQEELKEDIVDPGIIPQA